MICSASRTVISGVVQGSCIVPLLFLFYINDITTLFDNGIMSKLNADDIKLHKVVQSDLDSSRLQLCLDRLATWCAIWPLNIHKKSNVIKIGPASALLYKQQNRFAILETHLNQHKSPSKTLVLSCKATLNIAAISQFGSAKLTPDAFSCKQDCAMMSYLRSAYTQVYIRHLHCQAVSQTLEKSSDGVNSKEIDQTASRTVQAVLRWADNLSRVGHLRGQEVAIRPRNGLQNHIGTHWQWLPWRPEVFELYDGPSVRGHPCHVRSTLCKSSARYKFLSNRIVPLS